MNYSPLVKQGTVIIHESLFLALVGTEDTPLVAETWLGWESGTDLCVLHRDEERPLEFVDAADNLWLGTRRQNAEDRDKKKRLLGKKANCIPEQTRRKVHAIRKLGLIKREIADIVGLSRPAVTNILFRDVDNNEYYETRVA